MDAWKINFLLGALNGLFSGAFKKLLVSGRIRKRPKQIIISSQVFPDTLGKKQQRINSVTNCIMASQPTPPQRTPPPPKKYGFNKALLRETNG